MTINIALATYDGIILGCDSLSSMSDSVIFPFSNNIEYAKDAEGNLIFDATGHFVVAVNPATVTRVATTVFGGVSKIFCLYEAEAENDETCVAAVTAGLAILGGVTIAEQAKRYRRLCKQLGKTFSTVEAAARDFFDFCSVIWDAQFGETPAEQRHFLPTLQFIVAGYGAEDANGKIFRIDVQAQTVTEQFPGENYAGMCWAGASDYVERLMRGIDNSLVYAASRQISEALASQRVAVAEDITEALAKVGIKLHEGLELEITEHTPPSLPWDIASADIDFGNLSTQYAVELVELLVNTQSGMQRFARGIPTVGGRTHIGVLKRGEGFQLLNEPKLQHLHTGYSHDF
ncbi:hypothetical protein VDG05_16870 [Xanthomonas campestris pv. raphani]|uniref:hypothetical protein n=1 Tax=Xanthomonas campestris TaxID=339 RepID=UPI002B22500E|nr:hypothetical protein [Xanthomonas campestris]MEA9885982.1 hypothetical protein [Xanthomonas campestris pv. raphani]